MVKSNKPPHAHAHLCIALNGTYKWNVIIPEKSVELIFTTQAMYLLILLFFKYTCTAASWPDNNKNTMCAFHFVLIKVSKKKKKTFSIEWHKSIRLIIWNGAWCIHTKHVRWKCFSSPLLVRSLHPFLHKNILCRSRLSGDKSYEFISFF